jgi:menaquinone-specific isochorismate synthase
VIPGTETHDEDRTRLVIRTVEVDEDRHLLDLLPDGTGCAWVREGEGFVATGEAVRIRPPPGPDRFERAAAELGEVAAAADVDDRVEVPGSGLVAFGSFTFDADAAGSTLVVPEMVVGRRAGRTWLTVIGDPDRDRPPLPPPSPLRPPDRVRFAGASIDDVEWLAAVATAVARIGASEIDKVVLARDQHVWDRVPFDARVLARRLTEHFPGCFTFLCDGLIGATPELLVRRFGGEVGSLVLAGSAARDEDEDKDAHLGRLLLGSDKDRWEHRFAVESVRDVLAPVCRTLDVDPEPRLLLLENVQHLATHVTGTVAAGDAPSALHLAGLLHPTAAVGGTPRDAALELIRELETMDRGRYAAPVGWVDADGDGEWGIALRCAQLDGSRGRLFAGAGVVEGSFPENELEETRLKLRAMQSALEG